MTTVFTTYLKTKQFFYINTINMGCSNVLKLINFEVFSYDPFYHLIKSETQFWHWFPFPVIPLDLVFQPFVFPLYDVFHLGFEPDWTLLFWAFFVECRKEPFLVEKKCHCQGLFTIDWCSPSRKSDFPTPWRDHLCHSKFARYYYNIWDRPLGNDARKYSLLKNGNRKQNRELLCDTLNKKFNWVEYLQGA